MNNDITVETLDQKKSCGCGTCYKKVAIIIAGHKFVSETVIHGRDDIKDFVEEITGTLTKNMGFVEDTAASA